MIPSRRLAILALALSLSAMSGPEGSVGDGESRDAPSIRSLRVLTGNIDEGSFARLLADAETPTGNTLTYIWELGDGSPPRRGRGLTSIDHRYVDEGSGIVTVRLTVEDPAGGTATRSTTFMVRNVAPTIDRMARHGAALVDAPLTFEAGYSDPGLADEWTLRWDFGDGGTAVGPTPRHVYRAPGTYTVRLVVDDGDGGSDERSMGVTVGDGGAYSVTGDAVIPTTELTFASVGGTPLQGGLCQLRLSLNLEGNAVLSLAAILPGGLGEGRYSIGVARNDVEMWADEMAMPGVFTSTLSLDARHDPPDRPRFGFGSIGGVLDIEYFDGERVEGTFEIALREFAVPSAGPGNVSVSGYFAQAVTRDPMGVSSGRFYLCDLGAAPMVVEEWNPGPNAWNVDWEEPDVFIRFNRAIDPASLAGNFTLEHRTADGTESGPLAARRFREIGGDWIVDAGDPTVVRFVPGAPLPDAVVFCLRVHTGYDGVRATTGEFLGWGRSVYDARTAPACTRSDRFSGRTISAAFATTPALENVRAAVYQVHRDLPLIPGKPTLTRVLWDWHAPPAQLGIHRAAQVDSFPADVWVDTGEGGYGTAVRRPLLRSDRYSFEDTVFARNGVNFHGWRPGPGGGGVVRATVEPSGQARSTPRRFEGRSVGVIQRERHSPVITMDYVFLRVGSWEAGVPESARAEGHRLMQSGAAFTTQNFPVVETRVRYRGEVDAWEDWGRRATTPAGEEIRRGWTPVATDEAVAWDFWQAMQGSEADVIVGLFPRDLQPSRVGVVYDFGSDGRDTGGLLYSTRLGGRRVILLMVDEANAHTVAHETGHYYGLCHVGGATTLAGVALENDCVTERHTGEGFRILPGGLRGWNKDGVNAEAPDRRHLAPLMREGTGTPELNFVSRQHYTRLTRNVQAVEDVRTAQGGEGASEARVASRAAHRLDPPRHRRVALRTVSGVIDLATGRGGFLDFDEPVEGPLPPSPDQGTTRVRLLGPSGDELGTAVVRPTRARVADRLDVADDGVAYFSTPLPWDSRGTRLVLEFEGRIVAERVASDAPPRVRFETPDDPSLEGSVTLRWRGDDSDGDDLLYSLSWSDDGDRWTPLVRWAAASEYSFSSDALDAPDGTVQFRVVATDGFHVAEARLSARVPPRLRILSILPAPTDRTSTADVVVVSFHGVPAMDRLENDALSLRGEDGTPVDATLVAVDGGRELVLVPDTPLALGATYGVRLSGGLAAVDGRRFPADSTWTVRVMRPAGADDTGAFAEFHGEAEGALVVGRAQAVRLASSPRPLDVEGADFSLGLILGGIDGCPVPDALRPRLDSRGVLPLDGALEVAVDEESALVLVLDIEVARIVITSPPGSVESASTAPGVTRHEVRDARLEIRAGADNWRCDAPRTLAFTVTGA